MLNTVAHAGKKVSPSKIVCVGRNYLDHIQEMSNDMPSEIVFFTKSNSAIGNELCSFKQEPLHYELELCFLISSGTFQGLGLGLDLTKRALQRKLKNKGLPWERAKAFDGAAVFSEFIAMPPSINDLNFSLHVNEELRQSGHVNDMLFKPHEVLQECMKFMTLVDGDILMTGTPSGVGEVKCGDHFFATLCNGNRTLLEASWSAS